MPLTNNTGNKPESWVPIPDPTILTSDHVAREIAALRELIEARLDAGDLATNLRLQAAHETASTTLREIAHASELQMTQTEALRHEMELRFVEWATRTDQAAVAGKEALAAALQAAKELVGQQSEAATAAAAKTEASFTKQVDQITVLIETRGKASDARVDELKERVDRGEGASKGTTEARTGMSQTMIGAFLGLSVLISIIAIIVTIVLHH